MNLREARGSRTALVPRTSGPALTEDFGSVWPEVAGRLRSMLRRRGVRHHDIDEIVQETAARAISTGLPFDDADDLFRWTSVVGGRLAIDLRRKGARLSDDELPDRADTVDVAMTAEHRVVLGAVRNRLTELSARDQAVLLSSFHDEPVSTRRESVRVAVARHRARNRLRVLLNGLAGSGILLWIRRNRIWSAPVEAISYAVVPTAACLLITVGAWMGLSNNGSTGAPAEPQRAAQVVAVRSASAVAAPTASGAPGGGDGSTESPLRPPSVPAVRDPYVIVDEPGGSQTRAGIRDKEASDHLWCVTTPSLSGPQTRCFDSPVPLPATP